MIEGLLPAPGSAVDLPGSQALYAMGVARRLAGDADSALRFQQQAIQTIATGRGAELRRMRAVTEIGLTLLDLARPAEAAASLEQALMLCDQLQIGAVPDRTDIEDGLERARTRH
jgi:hypothetical protein